MQSSLQQAGVSQPGSSGAGHPFNGGVWSSHAWLMAAATVGTVAVVSFSIWQRNEINQLRQTISELNQHQATMQPAQPKSDLGSLKEIRPDVASSGEKTATTSGKTPTTLPNQAKGLPVHADTVYVTRYVDVPAHPRLETPVTKRANQSLEAPNEQRYATTTHAPAATGAPTQSDNLTTNSKTESYGTSSTSIPSLIDKNEYNSSVTTDKALNSLVKNGSTGRTKKGRGAKVNALYPSNFIDNQGHVSIDKVTPQQGVQPDNVVSNSNFITDKTAIQPESSSVGTSVLATNYAEMASRPLSTKSTNWNALVAQRARRMRSMRVSSPTPAVVEQPQMPTSQPVRELAIRFRAGVGGEVTSSLWSAGVFTEVLLGRHWTLGVGLSQATYKTAFITDDEFDTQTHRNFRNEFGQGIDPFRDILNINMSQVRLQIPLSLGYRIPLNQTFTLLPTIGTYVNLNSTENVTYYCRQYLLPPQKTQRGFDEEAINKSQPVDPVNSLALGAGLEWHRNHWAIQASPVLTIPMMNNLKTLLTDLNWQQNTTVSLRARLLYQF